MVRWSLHGDLRKSPKCWQNFVMHHNPTGYTPDKVHEAMVEFSARFNYTEEYLEFDKESDYVMFVLKWNHTT